jgi:uncharacterized protein involved in outer membrane biogenesis
MKKSIPILVGILAILIVVSFVKDVIIKVSVEKGVQAATGLPLKMQGFRVGIMRTLVGIKNLKLYNPKGYPDKVMLDMPQIYVDYNLLPIFKGKVHVQDMRMSLKEFTVVKNKDGEVNIDSLNVVKEQKEKKRTKRTEKKTSGKALAMQIDNLELKVGKVIYKDYSTSEEPTVREFEVNIDQRYQNVEDPYTLISLILVNSLAGTAVARLADVDINSMKRSISGTLSTAQDVTGDAAVQAQEVWEKTSEETRVAAQRAAEKAEKSAKEAGAQLKKTAEDLKEKFKFSFGEDQ